jgi:hypothetical protein
MRVDFGAYGRSRMASCCAALLIACGGGGGGRDGGDDPADSGTSRRDADDDVDSGRTIPGDPALVCVEECTTNADCFIEDEDASFECLAGRCRPTTCDENLDCVALLGEPPPCTGIACIFVIPWFVTACTSDANCEFDTVFGTVSGSCVNLGNADAGPRNVCAPRPTDGRCSGAQEPIELERVGGSGTVEVCAYHDAACERGSCRNPCSDDNECLMVANSWLTQCESDADCRPGEDNAFQERRCIRLGGKQVCAQPAVPMGTPPNRAPDCMGQNIEVDLAGGGTFVACGASVMCDAETDACVPRCINDGDCGGSTPICNEGTGQCECGEDEDCADVPGHPLCVQGSCRCGEDEHCADFPNGDVCTDGSCGCSGSSACDRSRTFDGTTWTCVDPEEI